MINALKHLNYELYFKKINSLCLYKLLHDIVALENNYY